MAGHKKVNSKVEVKPEVKKEVEVKPVVEVKSTPVKKGGKVPPVKSEPVVEVKSEPIVEKTSVKKGGKVTKSEQVPVPVPVVEQKTAPMKRGKVSKSEQVPVVEQKTAPMKGGKVTKSKLKLNVETSPKVTDNVEEDGDEKKQIRSFKVRLPGSESFEGRFTGLTPYQAANKALSKYYRESNELQKEVTFSICESTRKSRKTTYTYIGGRHELSVPVTYTIADGRLITKRYKNVLKKVKKMDEVSASAST